MLESGEYLLDETPAPDIQVSQVWLGWPAGAAAATQTVGAFGQAATGEVYVSASLGGTVGDFAGAQTGEVWVEAAASQDVGAFTQTATGDGEAEPEPEPEPEAPARRGGGVSRGTRRFVVRIDDDEFIVGSAAEAQAIVDQAVALAQESARATAEQLAQRDTVRMRAAKRAAPVVRIESPESDRNGPESDTTGSVTFLAAEANDRIQQMYVDALRTALIAREIQARMEQDEEEALAVLLL